MRRNWVLVFQRTSKINLLCEAKWRRLFAICKLKFDLSSAVNYLEASDRLLTFLIFCTFSYRFLYYPEQLFDLLLSLGIQSVAVVTEAGSGVVI